LGARQHGHIDSVGFDLYTRLLAQAINEARRKKDRFEKAVQTSTVEAGEEGTTAAEVTIMDSTDGTAPTAVTEPAADSARDWELTIAIDGEDEEPIPFDLEDPLAPPVTLDLPLDARIPAWYIEAHQFRIDTEHGIGRPTPEGAHRDGVDFIAIVLVARERVIGGETRVFPLGSDQGVRFTLEEPWSALLLDDTRVVHETTPIQQAASDVGWRDTPVITYRAGGFQAPG
jgi:hypothetical protein